MLVRAGSEGTVLMAEQDPELLVPDSSSIVGVCP
jgi:hypothetical protein